ncbi:MAG TPA: site-2 protease family protein, partial [Micromonosporaceae bacterium]|nr:site-2 protease family protein [Micromonosporaceae bacterium]
MTTFGIVLFAVIILVSVCLHEAGHMLTAKRFGMKVTRYFAGFGPTLWSFKKGETEYGVKAIPLGGFVKIVGMTPQDDDVAPEDEPRAMWRFPVWKRTVVMAAGSVTHFIIGFILLWIIASFLGLPNAQAQKYGENVNAAPAYVTVGPCVVLASPGTADCGPNDPASPARVAGLQDGDRITAVDGVPTDNFGQVVDKIRNATSADNTITYVRGTAAPVTVPVKLQAVQRPPQDQPDGAPVPTYALGIQWSLPPGVSPTITSGPIRGVGAAASYMGTSFSQIGGALTALPGKIPGLWDALNGKPRDPTGPISVVGASEIGGQTAALQAWNLFLLIAAELNFFVGVFNLLPLLPLDGGHIAIAWYERVRSWWASKRRKPDPGRVDYYKLMPLTY